MLINIQIHNTAEPAIHAIEKITDQTKSFSHELRFMAPQRAGDYEMELRVMSDCYIGFFLLFFVIFYYIILYCIILYETIEYFMIPYNTE